MKSLIVRDLVSIRKAILISFCIISITWLSIIISSYLLPVDRLGLITLSIIVMILISFYLTTSISDKEIMNGVNEKILQTPVKNLTVVVSRYISVFIIMISVSLITHIFLGIYLYIYDFPWTTFVTMVKVSLIIIHFTIFAIYMRLAAYYTITFLGSVWVGRVSVIVSFFFFFIFPSVYSSEKYGVGHTQLEAYYAASSWVLLIFPLYTLIMISMFVSAYGIKKRRTLQYAGGAFTSFVIIALGALYVQGAVINNNAVYEYVQIIEDTRVEEIHLQLLEVPSEHYEEAYQLYFQIDFSQPTHDFYVIESEANILLNVDGIVSKYINRNQFNDMALYFQSSDYLNKERIYTSAYLHSEEVLSKEDVREFQQLYTEEDFTFYYDSPWMEERVEIKSREG
ncbi:ABC-2 transporter permease [Evansella cellulosilytica]|uniref:Uncharacterized protein n=1 Tax=Evansella cellulosilytica (strain ATCC 21833 / DSM 2522 / FERM P-1141 / JCM 9156 / N-4) TaxID=649639 RepID=E6TVB8_EVAC2|nr:ABC-2 transporter permease [Evansella cellulosilytica]ADU29802.1 hypothetical protein Bcell_1539 [Evansella cellulosilytica DSM 2522]